MWTAKHRYALRALIVLAHKGTRISTGEIAERYDVPAKYLESILAALRDAGLVHSSRGRGGGVRLAADPAGISLAAIFDAVEPGWLSQVASPNAQRPPEADSLEGIAQLVGDRLSGTSLADALAAWQRGTRSPDWVI